MISFLFFLAGARMLQIEVLSPYLQLGPRFQYSDKENSSAKSDIIISAKYLHSMKKPQCHIQAPIRIPYVYANNNNNVTKLVSFIDYPLFNSQILNAFESLGYIPVSSFNSNSFLLISMEKVNYQGFELDNDQKILNYLPKNVTAFVYSNITNNPLCKENCKHLSTYLISFLLCLFFLLLSIRLYFKILKLDINNDYTIWFTDEKGQPLTTPKLFGNYKAPILPAGKQEISVLNSMKQDPAVYLFDRTHVFYVNDYIRLVFRWTEPFYETQEESTQIIKGAVLTLDDQDHIFHPEIQINYRVGQYSNVEIKFDVDEQPCSITLETSDHTLLPFSEYSLHSAYLDCVQLGTLNEGIKTYFNNQTFNQYISYAYQRLDFRGFALVMAESNKFTPVFFEAQNEDLKATMNKFIPTIPSSDRLDKLTVLNTPNYRLEGNRFSALSIEYIVVIAYDSHTLILQESEQTFHSLYSIIIAFHHSLLLSREEADVLKRLNNLLSQTHCFSLFECKDHPLSFYESQFQIYNEILDQDLLNHLISQIDVNVLEEIKAMDHKSDVIRKVIPIEHPTHGHIMASLAASCYYDPTLESDIYLYFVENVTSFHERTKQFAMAHDEAALASNFLGIHRLKPDRRIVFRDVFQRELGFTKPIIIIDEIISQQDVELFKHAPDTIFDFHIISPLGHLVKYSALKVHHGFLVFSSNEMRQLLSMVGKEKEEVIMNSPAETRQFLLATVDQDTGQVDQIVTNESLSAAINIGNLMNYVHPKDLNIFKENFELLKESKKQETHFNVRISFNNEKYQWFTVALYQSEARKMLKFLINSDNEVRHKNRLSNIETKVELAFQCSKLIPWIFEDSNYPERSFTSLPSARNTMIMNWTTIEYNVREDFKERVVESLHDCLNGKAGINILVPLMFEECRWFLFRGELKSNMQVMGVTIDLTGFIFSDTAVTSVQKQVLLESKRLALVKVILTCLLKIEFNMSVVYQKEFKDQNDSEISLLIKSFDQLMEQLPDFGYD